ncbi:MAG TPA: bifunctional tRNA (5-methylaminomethyl-2-thiouridine)(34)-methyltransferase MnmD/FAD-dependent 5-carboxymethylaminomethyl-2-thiouridine(34) oxidoreductase MnmC [Caulobacterales bacterium]|nr:bifunctional tRNA (5-methylaminomethyl-2-thiouridine)(34)-methyltransferase MnmD/FAD-dependent 5-carboxymethylaminomethyl-2-thiouridine(34) oxidoreductase MnmC [Caulobacterales bacterium]
MSRLPPQPELDWSDAGAPRARAFDDIYFSARGGLAESEAVFLDGCGLPQAWRERARFAVCELGFGTGLNALATWRAWRATRPPGAVLHFCSVEAFPLARADAERALWAFPEISKLAERLLARWPVRAYAPQRLWFEDDGFALTLFVGDAARVLAGMRAAFDAWFLDGFAPARNADMWSAAVFAEMARLSAPGARAATFSVAGRVRRGLEAVGFRVEKKAGFAEKRERLEATWIAAGPAPATLYPYAPAHPKRVAIVGAGIAGAACARALARRGVETVVLDEAPECAAGASGNPGGLVMPRLDRGDGPARELFLAAFLDAVAAYADLGAFDACGVLECADPRHLHVLADMLADPPLPEDWRRAVDGGALHVRAGVARPREAIRAWLSNAELMCGAEIAALERAGEGWVLRAPDLRAWLRADAVVLACGAALTRFAPARFLPINLSRGQIEWAALQGARPEHAQLRGSYAAPFEDGVLFGATFDPVQTPEDGTARARNLAALTLLAPDIAARLRTGTLRSRAALRATPKDFMPIAGLLPRAEDWLMRFAGLAQGRPPDLTAPAPAHGGLYVLGGLGARGLTLAPLLGERIAAEMCGEPLPLSLKTLDAVHPARFLHRALRRGG